MLYATQTVFIPLYSNFGGGGLVALLLLSYKCVVAVDILWLFLAVPWVGLQYVIVVFPDNTH